MKMKLYTGFGCLLLLLPVFCQHAGMRSDSLTKQNSVLPPCQSCKTLVTSFQKGMERTARGKFEGGDAAWEEERLGSYANSEVRLVEIQEKLCLGLEKGGDQCHSLAEENEQAIEEWWFKKQKQEPDLFRHLCIDTLKSCCPDLHFGPSCTPCPGFPGNVCFNNGKCKGAGTRKGSGQCACEEGYAGAACERCAARFHESYRDATKVLCSGCHAACQGDCARGGPKGCTACRPGWAMDTERGCSDINECLQEVDACRADQFCVNSEGSFACLACDRSCGSCTGDGPDMCVKCAEGYVLHDNMCLDGVQLSRDSHVSLARYLTYAGLCVATCIIFQKSTVAAGAVGLSVALYISASEYMLRSEGDANRLSLDNFLLPAAS